jgi:hypothetical protein
MRLISRVSVLLKGRQGGKGDRGYVREMFHNSFRTAVCVHFLAKKNRDFQSLIQPKN